MPQLVGEASHRVDGQMGTSTKSGKITSIRTDWEDKLLARIDVEYPNGNSSEGPAPTITDTITVTKKQSKQLALGDHIKVTTSIEKVG
ncbi:hypothetical protein LCGC14_2271770 [marine sediment metagenome]|uniref:Uncharacterized protein n=1 Tax=marine sediment metagenome TaxID=412755 RepID=A0A0F9CWS8_9ZZZZ